VLDRAAREPVSAELTDPQTAKPFTVKLSRKGVAQTLRYMLYVPAASAHLPFAASSRPLAKAGRSLLSMRRSWLPSSPRCRASSSPASSIR